jgi:predicted NUDIX family NTP pyrophosphohydrolase
MESLLPIRSAGLVLYRQHGRGLEVFLVHPGGPFWARKDEGAWSIPKGLIEGAEDPLAAARREFAEETGSLVEGAFVPLGDFRQPSGKLVLAWAIEGDLDLSGFRSNSFEMEWPPRSGTLQRFPEADRGGWFDADTAMRKVTKGQVPILQALRDYLKQ